MAFADKKRMIEYNETYKREHYDRIDIRFRKGGRALLQSAADSVGESVAEYVRAAVKTRLVSDGFDVPSQF